MYIYINGEFVLEEQARISPFDHGFLYGVGLFETFRIYNGHPFLLDDHFQRLLTSLRGLHINLQMTKGELVDILKQQLLLNKLENAYVRFNVSAGEAPIGLKTTPYENPNVIIFMKPLIVPLAREKNAVVLTTPRNTPEGNTRYKSHHYLNNILGKREVPDIDIEGIFLTKDGYLAEGVVSNLFWVKDGQVFTPSVDTGILDGITRRFVIELLKSKGIICNEGLYQEDLLLVADEVFITNSIQEVVSIKQVNNKVYRTENQKITRYLQTLYEHYTSLHTWTVKEIERC